MSNTDARRLLSQALEAGARRDYDKAVSLLTAAVGRGDAPPEAFLYLGRARHARGEFGLAIDTFRRYLEDGGDRGSGLFFLGRSYLACGRLDQALACLRRSAREAPGAPHAWALLGAACLKTRRSKAAMDCLERAVSLAPGDERIYRGYLNAAFARGARLLSRGDADMARQLLGFAIDNGLDGTAQRLWRAKAYRELGRIDEALADCDEALRRSPGDSSIRWLRAGLLLASGRQAEALSEFEALRRADPNLPGLPADDRSLARIRASTAFRGERWREALSASLALLRDEPADPALRAIAAESLRALGELERSRNHWRRAVEADPDSPELRLGLGLALYDSGQYEEALRAVERARRLGAEAGEADYYSALCRARLGEEPDKLVPVLQSLLRARMASTGGADARLMFALGESLFRSGRPELAVGWFDKVLVLSPAHELSLLYRISSLESAAGGSSLEIGAAAIDEAYAAYLERYPDNAKLRREQVNRLVSGKKWEEAASALEKGLAYEGPLPGPRRLLAACYRNAGRYREAAAIYRDQLRAAPASGEHLVDLAYCLDRDGQSALALALLEKAPAAAKTGSAPWMLMSSLAARAGRKEAAVDSLRKAAEIDPGNERVWRNLAALYRGMGLAEFAASSEERAAKLAKPAQGKGAVDQLGRGSRKR